MMAREKLTKKAAETGRKWRPNAQLIAMAEMLVNPDDRRTKTEKIKAAGLSERTFYRWMRDERYIAYVNSLLDRYTNAALPSVWRALIRKCNLGDTAAIKLYFELKGMYSQKHEVTGKDGGPIHEKLEIVFDYGDGDDADGGDSNA